MNKKRQFTLDEEEKAYEGSLAAGEWGPVSHSKRSMYEAAAKNTVKDQKKESRVNIRMTEHELSLVKSTAEQEGIPYQTLMSSILHKYLTGQLVERRVIDELQFAFSKTQRTHRGGGSRKKSTDSYKKTGT